VNEAGNDVGEYSPTFSGSVSYNNYNSNNCTVGIYSKPMNQWEPQLDKSFQGGYTVHSLYTAYNNSWVSVRRTILIDQPFNSAPPLLYSLFLCPLSLLLERPTKTELKQPFQNPTLRLGLLFILLLLMG